eukprot:m51a1_g7872 putative C-tail anchored protein (164) ;mRNA; r:15732-16279
MRGRELTVNVPVWDMRYSLVGPVAMSDGAGNEVHVKVSDCVHPRTYWPYFISELEAELEKCKIRAGRCADGDLRLSKHVTLRNEAYVAVAPAVSLQGNSSSSSSSAGEVAPGYPDNSLGWNAAGHPLPFDFAEQRGFALSQCNIFLLACVALLLAALVVVRHT